MRRRRQRQAGFRVMRGVVEQHQPRSSSTLEIHDVQRGRILIEIVPVAARVESQQRAQQQTDRRLVRNDDHRTALMAAHDFDQRGQGTGRDRQTAFTALRREGVGIFLPRCGFRGNFSSPSWRVSSLPMADGISPSRRAAELKPVSGAEKSPPRFPSSGPAARHTPPRPGSR